ncbi:hypothetical protein EPN28_01580 [Patescibacteria group bacterium]|nr:MAG: hypothetical protein EPN28_01580 [Patescibacteria group bacterium]
MFGKKPTISAEESKLEVQTIPPDFYAGQNPAIKFKKVEKEIILEQKPVLTASEKKLMDKDAAAGAGDNLHPANLLASKKFMALAAAVLFVLAVGLVGWYYWNQATKQKTAVAPPPPVLAPAPEPVAEEPVLVLAEPTSTAVNEPTTTISIGEAALNFPSPFLSLAFDLDKDDIADEAEAIFGTDKDNPDKDGDSHNDGHEVYNLYNPKGMEPEKLIEAGTVKEYTNPVYGYSLYYPNDWAVGDTDQTYSDVLFSTLGGENIEVRAFELNDETRTFADWFAKWAPGEKYAEVVDFETFFKLPAKRRADWLVYYFTDGNRMYALLYHPGEAAAVNYGIVIKMLARSFRFAATVTPTP